MKKYFIVLILLLFCSLLPASRTFFGMNGLQAEAALVQASFSAMEGILKANPFGEADTPSLSQVLLDNAAELRTRLEDLGTKLDQKMEYLTSEQRQQAIYAYSEFLIQLADLKKNADNRFLFDVSAQLGDTYHQCGISHFIWGNRYNLKIPDMPAI